ncbi:MAG: hypothetical protein HRU03_00035 [Nanoarchaeales archaeon]|nr:hypothetical protein [Nanoarchaeales archaeon]
MEKIYDLDSFNFLEKRNYEKTENKDETDFDFTYIKIIEDNKINFYFGVYSDYSNKKNEIHTIYFSFRTKSLCLTMDEIIKKSILFNSDLKKLKNHNYDITKFGFQIMEYDMYSQFEPDRYIRTSEVQERLKKEVSSYYSIKFKTEDYSLKQIKKHLETLDDILS